MKIMREEQHRVLNVHIKDELPMRNKILLVAIGNFSIIIQGVFNFQAFLLTCRCVVIYSKEF
jgi:hypothetical protein